MRRGIPSEGAGIEATEQRRAARRTGVVEGQPGKRSCRPPCVAKGEARPVPRELFGGRPPELLLRFQQLLTPLRPSSMSFPKASYISVSFPSRSRIVPQLTELSEHRRRQHDLSPVLDPHTLAGRSPRTRTSS